MDHADPCVALRLVRFVIGRPSGGADPFRPAVADEVGDVLEDQHSHPAGNLAVLHGVVVEHVGDDHRLQQADHHEGQTHREVDTY